MSSEKKRNPNEMRRLKEAAEKIPEIRILQELYVAF